MAWCHNMWQGRGRDKGERLLVELSRTPETSLEYNVAPVRWEAGNKRQAPRRSHQVSLDPNAQQHCSTGCRSVPECRRESNGDHGTTPRSDRRKRNAGPTVGDWRCQKAAPLPCRYARGHFGLDPRSGSAEATRRSQNTFRATQTKWEDRIGSLEFLARHVCAEPYLAHRRGLPAGFQAAEKLGVRRPTAEKERLHGANIWLGCDQREK